MLAKMISELLPLIRDRLPFGRKFSGIDHQALAKIRITQPKVHPDVVKINNTKIQLYTWDNFLSSVECNALIEIINKHLRPSTLTYSNGDDQFRTSTTCDLAAINNSFVQEIDVKISKALGVYLCYSEAMQGQRYDVGQEFKAHTDFFEPGTSVFDEYTKVQGQRTWTFMIYLQGTEKGGGTKFVNLDKTFYPKLGQAVIWNNLDEFGRPNRDTLHHGMKVQSGSKIIITKWFREKGEGPMLYSVTNKKT
jgi:prolyl 4-hydroxylase